MALMWQDPFTFCPRPLYHLLIWLFVMAISVAEKLRFPVSLG